MTGIYQITNKVNNRKYIGKSGNIFIRWQKHIADLSNNSHHNEKLQRDFKKYGFASFIFEILETCSNAELNEFEN